MSTGRLAALVQWNAHKGTSPSSPHDDVHTLIDQREWTVTQGIDKVSNTLLPGVADNVRFITSI